MKRNWELVRLIEILIMREGVLIVFHYYTYSKECFWRLTWGGHELLDKLGSDAATI